MRAPDRWRLEENTRFGCASGASGTGAKGRGIAYHKRFYKTLRLHCLVQLQPFTLYIEPWFRNCVNHKLRSPDAVLVDPTNGRALVIEAKMNWKDGRDVKLIDEYLGIVASAFNVSTKPLLVTGNVRGLDRQPILGLQGIEAAWNWRLGEPTPVALVL